MIKSIPVLSLLLLFLAACGEGPIDFTTSQWELLTEDFLGPRAEERGDINPFTDYRLDVTLTHESGQTWVLPGYFVADGHAAESGAEAGNVWRAHFRPPLTGRWTWAAELRKGVDIYLAEDSGEGEALALPNSVGSFWVDPPKAGEPGQLLPAEGRYRHWAVTGEAFLKMGAGSPENVLAYADFDGTYRHLNDFRDGESSADGLHAYQPHLVDWEENDPSWRGGKGKGLIGGLNYLAEQGVNSVYMLTMNINGDGKDVWPYVDHQTRDRFDCSKLDQWARVFDYMDDSLGMMLHFVLQETENETLLDGGDLGPQRKLYFREMLARFGHHRAVTWNMGEENGPNSWSEGHQTNAQQAASLAWWAANDPYQHQRLIHTHSEPGQIDSIYTPLLGNPDLDGLSLQLADRDLSNMVLSDWLNRSEAAGAVWSISLDEIGPWWRGVDHDDRPDNNQDSVRAYALWGSLLAGGSGVEWYFGARNPHNDLGLEDWRSRHRVWQWTRYGSDFFREHLPFTRMAAHNDLVSTGSFCFAAAGEVYAIGMPQGGETTLDLSGVVGDFDLRWYDPRTGEDLFTGTLETVEGGNEVTISAPSAGEDWVALLEKK